MTAAILQGLPLSPDTITDKENNYAGIQPEQLKPVSQSIQSKTRGSQESVIPHLVFNLTSKFHRKNISQFFFFCHLKFQLIVMAAILEQDNFSSSF